MLSMTRQTAKALQLTYSQPSSKQPANQQTNQLQPSTSLTTALHQSSSPDQAGCVLNDNRHQPANHCTPPHILPPIITQSSL